ncbi:MAG TPA: bifunctional diaminohydroxyphosphoribosylaminopyrimidine deaminase/5-amino-6-(5-phosphoribosylamino)uracil reductase RibD [Planctomycetota bacterium]|nr:bifunctional diaminohydroxyphosphoribosylaminopyrimidine deaminase/5-amino-6-(5-phosphoribosylamino)uracil reductase RibD [Planctomycetota bacterium]
MKRGSADERFMRRCFELAGRGRGSVEPNPMVGAVVVRGGRAVAEGWHRRFGSPHAEVDALDKAGSRAKGATLYVNLEPCSHFGKTPPCTGRILAAGVREVIAAVRDPNPAVDGRGFSLLRRRGVKVRTGPLEEEAIRLNRGFFKAHRRGLPYVGAKWAMTLDGKIATRTGDSRWVSGEKSRAWLREARDEFQAILVGANTALRDDPRLRGGKRHPIRIILDSNARLPLEAQVVRTAKEQRTIVVVTESAPPAKVRKLERAGVQIVRLEAPDLRILFEELARSGIHSILVEGGGEVHASLFEAGLADEVIVFVAPKIIGGRDAVSPVEGEGLAKMADALGLTGLAVERRGEDILIRGRARGSLT